MSTAAPGKTKRSLPVQSLPAALAFAFVLLSVVALVVAGSLQLFIDLRTQQLEISNNQRLIARDASRAVSSFVQDRLKVIETAVWLTDPLTLSAQEQRRILESLLGLQPAFRQLLLLDSQ